MVLVANITLGWPLRSGPTPLLAMLLWLAALGDGLSAQRLSNSADHQWPHWRGPRGNGVAPHADPPVEWSEDRNIRWKVRLDGQGHSSPIVWGDRIFVVSAIPFGEEVDPVPVTAPGAHDNVTITRHHRFVATAYRRDDGNKLWQRELCTSLPHEGGHYTGSVVSASPVTDGVDLIVSLGSRGVYGLSVDGERLWKKDFGVMQTLHAHGEGSSPALYGDVVVINWDHEAQSFIVALDKHTGEQRWRVLRDEVTSWATPLIVVHDGKPQVVVSGTGRVRGYDLATGEVLWACGGLSQNVVASPVAADGIVVAASSYDIRAMFAISLAGARGDVTGTDRVIWNRVRGTPYVPSPLLVDNSLYFLSHYQGILSHVRVSSGQDVHRPIRLAGFHEIYASPCWAAGRIYVTDRSGRTAVIQHGDEPRILAFNVLDDRISATPAVVDDEIIFRGERFLYGVGRP